MIYLTNDDLTADSYQRFITDSTSDIPGTIDKNEERAVMLVETYLQGRYDATLIFGLPWVLNNAEPPVKVSTTPIIKNELLADIVTKITLYKIFRRNPARKIPEDLQKDYDEAIKTLEKINSGRVTLDGLPTPTDTSGNPVQNAIWGNSSNRDYYL